MDLTEEELLQDNIHQFKNSCVPFCNLIPMLKVLKKRNLLLGIITNGFGEFQLNNIESLGIKEYFDIILVSEWEGVKKPDPEIFNRALMKLGLAANQSVFIGDHPANDVQAANNVGMIGVWNKDSQWFDVEADYTIDDLAEIPIVLDEINKFSKYVM